VTIDKKVIAARKAHTVETNAILKAIHERKLYEELLPFAEEVRATLREVVAKRGTNFENHLRKARAKMFRHLRVTYGWSYPYIARIFRRDHPSVMKAIARLNEDEAREKTQSISG
jgi:hypothetical protein